MDRRSFLTALGTVPLLSLGDAGLGYAAQADMRFLVLVELKGGNDGLNTLIPFSDATYYRRRPQLAVAKNKLLQLSRTVGMHPALNELSPLWDQGELAWLQGVGYPNQIRSHFSSIEVWDTGQLVDSDDDEGWVPRQFTRPGLKGVAINSRLGPLYSEALDTVGVVNPRKFAQQGRRIQAVNGRSGNIALDHVLQVQQGVDRLSDMFWARLKHAPKPAVAFPKGQFSQDLLSVYQLMRVGTNIPVFKVSLGSFDTHVGQKQKHEKLLKQLSKTLKVFTDNLKSSGLWDKTLIMTYSEFGRRLEENGNKGTDHGAAAPHFVLGGRVKGGLYGQYPSLNKLDKRGDLIYTTDFRDVYASISHLWWGNPVQGRRIIPFV